MNLRGTAVVRCCSHFDLHIRLSFTRAHVWSERERKKKKTEIVCILFYFILNSNILRGEKKRDISLAIR